MVEAVIIKTFIQQVPREATVFDKPFDVLGEIGHHRAVVELPILLPDAAAVVGATFLFDGDRIPSCEVDHIVWDSVRQVLKLHVCDRETDLPLPADFDLRPVKEQHAIVREQIDGAVAELVQQGWRIAR